MNISIWSVVSQVQMLLLIVIFFSNLSGPCQAEDVITNISNTQLSQAQHSLISLNMVSTHVNMLVHINIVSTYFNICQHFVNYDTTNILETDLFST